MKFLNILVSQSVQEKTCTFSKVRQNRPIKTTRKVKELKLKF